MEASKVLAQQAAASLSARRAAGGRCRRSKARFAGLAARGQCLRDALGLRLTLSCATCSLPYANMPLLSEVTSLYNASQCVVGLCDANFSGLSCIARLPPQSESRLVVTTCSWLCIQQIAPGAKSIPMQL